jgi:hypothetical protein
MTTMSEYIYPIQHFEAILEEGFDYDLPEETMRLINKISSQVGDPTYIKTPIFKKTVRNPNRKRRGKQKPLSDDQWEALRNFETTKIEKNENGIHKDLNVIRNKLNKLTDTTYEDVLDEVTRTVSHISGYAKGNDYIILHNTLFDICSTNTFYSEIFTKVYTELLHECSELMSIYNLRFNSQPILILQEFDKKHNISDLYEKVTSNNNYDELCRLNAIHDNKQALCSFVGHMIQNNMFEANIVYSFINELIQEFMELITVENKTRNCEDLSEILYEIILACKFYLKETDGEQYDDIVSEIETITEIDSNPEEYPSLNNKCVFKCMDLFDMILS